MNRRIKYLQKPLIYFLIEGWQFTSDPVSGEGESRKGLGVREVFLEEELACPELVLSKAVPGSLFTVLALGTHNSGL